MIPLDDYLIDTLMRDLVGHDRRPASFLVYLWIHSEQFRRQTPVAASYRDLGESIGISKSSAQSSVGWLLRRKLLSVTRESRTATPAYTVKRPWRRSTR